MRTELQNREELSQIETMFSSTMFWALNSNSHLSQSYYFNEKDDKSKI